MLCRTLCRIPLLCWLRCAEGLVCCEVVSCSSSGVINEGAGYRVAWDEMRVSPHIDCTVHRGQH